MSCLANQGNYEVCLCTWTICLYNGHTLQTHCYNALTTRLNEITISGTNINTTLCVFVIVIVFIMLRENHIQGLIWFRDYSNVLPIQDYSRTNPIQGLLKCSFYSGLIQVPLLFRTYLIWELFKEIYLFQRLSYSETIQFGLIIYRRYSRAIQRLACMWTNLF